MSDADDFNVAQILTTDMFKPLILYCTKTIEPSFNHVMNALDYLFLVYLKQLHCPGNGLRLKKQKNKLSAVTIEMACQNMDNCGHVEHRTSIPLFRGS